VFLFHLKNKPYPDSFKLAQTFLSSSSCGQKDKNVKAINFIEKSKRVLDYLAKIFNWFGYLALATIILITFADVSLRYCFDKPIKGSLDIIESTMAILGASAIVYTTMQRGHVSVDWLTSRFSRRARNIVLSFGSFLGFLTWGLVAYEAFLVGIAAVRDQEVSLVIAMPLGPFRIIMAIAFFLYCLIELLFAIKPLIPEKTEGESKL
jgi:TRAP-type transport system small permease protein